MTRAFAVVVTSLLSIGIVWSDKPVAAPSPTRPSAGWHVLPRPLVDDDFRTFPAAQVELGRLLFFDKILGGNRNISCATCHHPLVATGDGLALPVGEGGRGLAGTRCAGHGAEAIVERVPRNAPAVFNLGAREFTRMFHDGRLEVDPTRPSGFRSPAGDDLPAGLESVLAAQAMFPVTSAAEMAGQPGENDVANAAAAGDLAGPAGVWALLAARLAEVDEYVELFMNAYDEIDGPSQITFVHAANAIGAFEADAWRADDSPFDRYLRGDRRALSAAAFRGMRLFYSRAACASCHAGPLQTDHEFHATAMPQFGPGKGAGLDGLDDYGREGVTDDPTDRYRFRTPTLRNVALTGPWGHDGAFDTLEGAVRHMLDPIRSFLTYDRTQIAMPSRSDLDEFDFVVLDDPASAAALAAACEPKTVKLQDREIADLIEFLHALTDPASLDLRGDIPDRVPSGLPMVE